VSALALGLKDYIGRIYFYPMTRVASRLVFHRPGRYFTANLAEAGILKINA